MKVNVRKRSFLNGVILREYSRGKKNFARLQSQRSTEQESYRVCISLNEILINVSKQEETLANSFSTFIIIHLSLAELKQRRSR